ncbi:MAG: DUF309 domain-containing protein [Chloroflexota bacterium]
MADNVIVVTGPERIAGELPLPEGFALRSYATVTHFATRLINDRPVMVILMGSAAMSKSLTVAAKASPATRRIPIVVIVPAEAARADMLTSGADFALVSDEVEEKLPGIITKHARVPDPAREERLDCECRDTLPPLAVQGVEKFNNREFYPQHDLFEEQWVATEGPVRDLYRAVLQVGVAYYQIERGNHRGALKMLLRAVQWLEVLPDVCQTIDVAQLKTDAYAVRAELERMNPDDIAQFDRTLLKPVSRVT